MSNDATRTPEPDPTLASLIARARQGDKDATSSLFSALYPELRRIARARLRQHKSMTLLDTTALLHESYLKLIGANALPVEDRRHFFTYAATVMRSVIVDFARARAATRRGGHVDHVVLDTQLSASVSTPENDVLRVHEALETLTQADPRSARIVELRYFGGLSDVEIADALGVSERTVRRDWEKARLLLAAALD
jgi:RNA polymerase sigma factor (TIGR02999 family)